MTIREIQQAHASWAFRNFGRECTNERSKSSILGVVEEVGELAHSVLKQEQGIRGTKEEHDAAIQDAVGDIVIFLSDFCTRRKLDFEVCVERAWNEVKDRDFITFPKNGVSA
jgi:NTP pyrophosphatase (non-canonical NTP hydrolase)